MRIVFMGSADFSCATLRLLANDSRDSIVGVVTQPDRPKGRGREMHQSPVKAIAPAGAVVMTPGKVNSSDSVEAIRRLAPDLVVVVAYGQILRKELLAMPRLGCVNVHASLLPRYRGAAPIQWAVANGDRETGVTTMYMSEGMDEGDILKQKRVAIDPQDTGGTLHDKLASRGAELLGETIEDIRNGIARRIPQRAAEATIAPKLSKADGRIDWTMSAARICDRVRGFNPWPCCYCGEPGAVSGMLKVLRAGAEPGAGGQPGDILAWENAGPLVAADGGAVRLLEIQPGGGKAMSGSEYVRGHANPGRFP